MNLNHKIIGSGDPLVVLHGLFGMLDNWQSLGKRFGESRMAILLDQRNHGKSPHAPAVDYPTLAEDLSEFLESNWIHQADVLGHSMGGKTAMQFALSYPDKVNRLIVVDMGVGASARGHDVIFAAMDSIPLDEDLRREEIDELLARKIPQRGVRLFLMKNLRRKKTGGYAWKMNLPALQAGYEDILAAIDGEPFTKPTLFIRGERSNYIMDDDWPGIQQLFPNAELATVKGAGHWVHAEAPDEVYQLTEKFLTGS